MKKERYIKSNAVKELERLDFETKVKKYPSMRIENIPKKYFRDDSSNSLTDCVIKYIELNGYQAERINSTGRQIQTGLKNRWVKGSSKKGTSDISATIKGRSIKIEIKCEATNDNIQSDYQKDYQRQIEQAGGVYIIVRNFEGFFNWYQNFVE
ncbi:hypothetical protein [Empedobacter brevis]|uniref:hypothetical protein n=1 Tax=Empedobacter brevis TaxID=247 RepID=UPI00289850A7|nr:hypothetical protein [Empedobacter brevis]